MREINKVFVAGSGTMGMSIAQAFADKLYDVTVYDIAEKIPINGKRSYPHSSLKYVVARVSLLDK